MSGDVEIRNGGEPHNNNDAMDVDSPRPAADAQQSRMTVYYGRSNELSAQVKSRLSRLRDLMEKRRPESHKFDMIALREFNASENVERPSQAGIHPPGVPVGTEFHYRVELVVCGVHGKVMGGIDYVKDSVCKAVVLSGKYLGDDDRGDTLLYSGEGGGSVGNKRDQEWTNGNMALYASLQKKSPVRVIRCIPNLYPDAQFNAAKHYVYDGLYLVTNAWTDVSGKYRECRFQLQGIKGEYRVSGTVKVGDLYKGKPSRMPLSAQKHTNDKRQPLVIRPQGWGHRSAPKEILKLEQERKSFLEKRGNVLCMDLSEGKEAIRIPLIDDSVVNHELPKFTYVTSLYHTTEKADQLIQETAKHFVYDGCQKQEGRSNYDEYGCLQFTQPEGIKECPQSCSGCCNTVVSMRVRYPLEVFWTEEKEWGVRCSVDIPQGAFVCEYAGKILTDTEVEETISAKDSTYLFSLDHFYEMKKDALRGNTAIDEKDMPPLPLPDEQIKNDQFHGHFLVIDAKPYGNVGRFLNHACAKSANLIAQMVLLPGCNSTLHHVAFFAVCDIPKYQELLHDYGWRWKGTALDCKCNDPECSGRFSKS